MRFGPFLGLATIGLVSTGCITQEKYNALRFERDGLVEQLNRAGQDSAVAQQKAASYKLQLDELGKGSNALPGLVQNLTQENTTLKAQLADITARYNDAIGKIGQSQPLPVALTNELTNFAEQNPDLVEFDPKTGVVKFKSDLTFASGDAQLQENAKGAISRFATILNSPAAAGYELMVCGHADNQKVSAGTVQRGHKDNWYLSAHRALSVAEALQAQKVNPKRIGAVGYGEYRPIASNDSKQGMGQNRRVEVLILPTTVSDAAAPAATRTAAPAAAAPAVNAKEDQALNK